MEQTSEAGSDFEARDLAIVPLHVDDEAATGHESRDATFLLPIVGKSGEQLDDRILALHQHLGNACRATEIAIDLERRMSVEEVGVGAAAQLGFVRHIAFVRQTQLVLDELVGMVAIEETSPQTDTPAHCPTCRDVATMFEADLCRLGEVGRIACRNAIAGEKAVEMTHMTMVVGGIVPILDPFLQLSPRTYLHRSEFLDACLIVFGRSDIAQQTCRLSHFVPKVADELAVHGAACHRGGIVSLGSVFGRIGGANHEIMMEGFIDHRLVEETCGTLHHGIPLAQEIEVERIEIMLPKVRAKPSATRHPHTRRSIIDGTGDAPEVGVVMQHPRRGVAHAIHHTCRIASRLAHFANQSEEGLVEFGEIADLRGPIVHLEVDVAGVFAVPRGEHLVVPDALQIGRLSTRLRGGDEEVTSEAIVHRHEMLVVRLAEIAQTINGGAVGI